MSQFPLPGANWTYLHAFTLKATTGVSGYTLVNGTGDVLSWTAPNDGLMHRVMIFAVGHVTSATTGGNISASLSTPDGTVSEKTILSSNQATGTILTPVPASYPYQLMLIAPGSTVTILQFSALTGGAEIMWAEIWGL